jgi:hypothetical protein
MFAAARAPALTMEPDPPGAGTDMPSRIGRVLGVLRKLIDYGRHLATVVQQRAATPGFSLFARPFGTADLAVILARITAGLHRAATLQSRLCQRAARGRDLTPASVRLPAPRQPRPSRQVAPPDHPPAGPSVAPRLAEDPRLARLPTEAEIAAEMRRRPVGAVIVDIGRDLGIRPGDCDRPFWDELCHAIIAYGGSLAGFLDRLSKRLFDYDLSDDADPTRPTAPPRPSALATGPP